MKNTAYIKPLALAAALALALFLPACQLSQSQRGDGVLKDGALRVVATIFPQYDFIRQIAGDRVELAMLLNPGAESHGFEPTPRDIIALNSTDLFVYVGGEGDSWVAPILASLDREELRAVALFDLVEVVQQEIVEGMEVFRDDDHGHGHDDDEDDEEEGFHGASEYDEHVWTSPLNAIRITRALAEILAEMDPANADFFRANAAAFIAELEALFAEFQAVVANGNRGTVIFGDRFPFRYLMDHLGLEYYAAFSGCSAETQASPATIAFMIERTRAQNIPVVFHIEFSNRAIANVVSEATGARVAEFHSTHVVGRADFERGITYLDLMRRNVAALREALD